MTNNELVEETIRTLESLQNSWKETIDREIADFILEFREWCTDALTNKSAYIDNLQRKLEISANIQEDLYMLRKCIECAQWKSDIGKKTNDPE